VTRQQLLDLAERVGATAGEAAVGVLITYLSGLPAWWAIALVPVLSGAKSWLATKVTGTASLLRKRPEPAPPAPGE
jgi:hypothetical protein